MSALTHRSYVHRQFSNPALVSLIFCIVFAAILTWWIPLRGLLGVGILMAVLVVVAAVHFAFVSLTIEVGEGELRWHFGPGVWRKRLPLNSIANVKRDRLPWWYGVGVKYTPGAWAYLVAPGPAVRIATADGCIIRLGTDDPEGLMNALAGPRVA